MAKCYATKEELYKYIWREMIYQVRKACNKNCNKFV